VINLSSVLQALSAARSLAADGECKLLYSVKALALKELLSFLKPYVDGFSTSSLYESILARDVLDQEGQIHFTAPGFRSHDFEAIVTAVDRICFNSFSQWTNHREILAGRIESGLRVNPELSFVTDLRYAPCTGTSKLGITLSGLQQELSKTKDGVLGISGLHVHCNCESHNWEQLAWTVEWMIKNVGFLLERCTWLNIGGGYSFEHPLNTDRFIEAVRTLHSLYSVDVFLEPGAALVENAGSLHASIVDIFPAGAERIAVLDASVNHLPNVFSYQEPPVVRSANPAGRFRYTLAGATCLAGDVFGTYGFTEPLEIGGRIAFLRTGAYTLVKSHMFNGFALPTVYLQRDDNTLELIRRYEFADFASIYAGVGPAQND
jgi:carboxynorspermidine decarboxylase